MRFRDLLALFSLCAGVFGSVAAQSQPPVGVVVAVSGATLGTIPLSNGTTVFSGDLIGTADKGFVLIQAGKMQLALASRSIARFLRVDGHLVVELQSGLLAYSGTVGSAPLSVFVNDVPLAPDGSNSVIGQIDALSSCALSAYVAQGSLTVHFEKQPLTLREGQSHTFYPKIGVTYGSSHRSASGKSPEGPAPFTPDPAFLAQHSHVTCPNATARPSGNPPAAEKAVRMGIAATTGVATYLALESPDRP